MVRAEPRNRSTTGRSSAGKCSTATVSSMDRARNSAPPSRIGTRALVRRRLSLRSSDASFTSRVRTRGSLIRQRLFESPLVIESGLFGVTAAGVGLALAGKRAKAVRLLSQVHRTTRLSAMKRLAELYVARHPAAAARSDAAEEDISRLFGGRISVLKEPGANGERGVLFIMFTEILAAVFSRMDVPRLTADYTIVSEPSWSGYCDDAILRWTQVDAPVFVLAAQKDDFRFLKRLD